MNKKILFGEGTNEFKKSEQQTSSRDFGFAEGVINILKEADPNAAIYRFDAKDCRIDITINGEESEFIFNIDFPSGYQYEEPKIQTIQSQLIDLALPYVKNANLWHLKSACPWIVFNINHADMFNSMQGQFGDSSELAKEEYHPSISLHVSI